MSTAAKVGGFLVIVLVTFGAALGVGRWVGPVDAAPTGDHSETAGHGTADEGMDDMSGMEGMEGMEGSGAGAAGSVPKGLMVSQDGYTFRLPRATATPGASRQVSFVIEGPDGEPVTDFDLEHEKELHLIAVRRDFTGFQHVHPERAPDGTWSTTVDLTAGQWRLFADFKPAGADPLTLGQDLAVRGDYAPATPTPDTRTARVGDYTVTLEGDLVTDKDAELTLSVRRDGRPVTDLQPYLGAYGHLVALRSGDLAYLHVHPDGAPGDGRTEPGPEIVFYAGVPSPERYHLFLDFKHDGVVRTAAFSLTSSGTGAPDASQDEGSGDESGDESGDDGHANH